MADFVSRDPNNSCFWDERFSKKFTPWDKGAVPQDLRDFVLTATGKMRTLIPGCGNGYEAAFLAQAGWDVTAIDFSPAAVKSAQMAIGEWSRHVIEADFFEYQPAQPPELIYERAFFCALPPVRRQDIVQRWAELLPPGALLAGYFFFDTNADASKKGPPFSISDQVWQELMAPHFTLLTDRAVNDSIAVFEGCERWQIWQRRHATNGQ